MIADQVGGEPVGANHIPMGLARCRCLWVPDGVSDSRESSELALHVLAQSPVGVRASLPAWWALDRPLMQLLQAYRLDGLVDFRKSVDEVVQPPPNGLRVDVDSTTPAELIDRLDVVPGARPALHDEDGLLVGHRVVVVTNIPMHYRTALFRELDAQLKSSGARLQVIFLAGIPPDRSWIDPGDLDFDHVFLSSIDVGRRGQARRLAPRGLCAALDRSNPTIVLSAGFSPFVSGRIARWCSRRPGVAFGVWSGEVSQTAPRGRGRRWQRRQVLHGADFAIAYGWSSARYLRTLSSRVPIVIGRNTTPTPALLACERDSADVELLVVSRAVSHKRIDLVVDAVRQLALPNLRLTVVGDGPELPNLEARAAGSENIRFRGALSPEEVRESYTRADIFAFPTTYDVFGLVLVEAMAAGLAIVTSAAPGAVVDLAVDEQTCLIVSRPTVDDWRETLRRVCLDPDLRRRLGERGRASVLKRWTIGNAASAMVDGCRLAALTLESESEGR
jgi:glycosyltransferase involved in cell wall biosynthesis